MKKILVVGVNSILTGAIICEHENDIIDGVYYTKPNFCLKNNYSIDQLELIDREYDIVYIISAVISNDITQLDLLLRINVSDINRIVNKFSSSRIVFCSSVSVYNGLDSELIGDNSLLCSQTIYGLSKIMAENIIKRHNNYGILRISSIYGSNMKTNTFLPRVVDDAINKGVITLKGRGDRFQNYIHVKDVAALAKKIALSEGNKVIMAVSPHNYSNSEVVIIVSRYTNCSIKYSGEDSSKSYKYKTENLIVKGHQFVDFETGVQEIITWRRKQY